MSHVEKFAKGEPTLSALTTIAFKLGAMDQRQQADVARLEAGQARLEAGQARLEAGQVQLEAMLNKILEGQAVLLQNDMELMRRLDAKG